MEDDINGLIGDDPTKVTEPPASRRNAIYVEGLLKQSDMKSEEVTLSFEPESLEEVINCLRSFEKLEIDGKGVREQAWRESMSNCSDGRVPYFGDFNKRPELLIGYRGDGHVKQIKEVTLNPSAKNRELSPEVALTYLQSLTGKGVIVDVPLPHSGIWVRLKPPTEAALMDLWNNLFLKKIKLGRETSGKIFSNFSVYVNARLAEFIALHVIATNFTHINKENLLSHVSMLDLPALILGFAKAKFFQGFSYNRPCIGRIDPETPCMEITTTKILPENMLWVDNSAIHETVKEYYHNSSPNANTEDKWAEVLKHNAFSATKVVKYDGMELHLRIPSIKEHANDGTAWISHLVDAVDAALIEASSVDDEEAKEDLLGTKIHMTFLRQYSHFVGKIVFSANGNYVENRAAISTLLSELSTKKAFVPLMFEEVHDLINKAAVAVVGIPEHTCPKCGRNQRGEEEKNRWEIIPVNPLYVFFSLASRLLAEVIEAA